MIKNVQKIKKTLNTLEQFTFMTQNSQTINTVMLSLYYHY